MYSGPSFPPPPPPLPLPSPAPHPRPLLCSLASHKALDFALASTSTCLGVIIHRGCQPAPVLHPIADNLCFGKSKRNDDVVAGRRTRPCVRFFTASTLTPSSTLRTTLRLPFCATPAAMRGMAPLSSSSSTHCSGGGVSRAIDVVILCAKLLPMWRFCSLNGSTSPVPTLFDVVELAAREAYFQRRPWEEGHDFFPEGMLHDVCPGRLVDGGTTSWPSRVLQRCVRYFNKRNLIFRHS